MGKRIGVIGAGAIGGTIGGLMTKGGEDVLLIDPWKEHVEAMRTKGLHIQTLKDDHHVEVKAIHTDEIKQVKDTFDILIVSVKTYDTEWALDFMAPYIRDDTWVVSAQNCINEEIIAPIVGARRTVGCMILLSTWLQEPAHIRHYMSMGEQVKGGDVNFTVGELDGRITPRVEELAQLFAHVGGSQATKDLWAERWSKLAINCMANAVSGITGLGNFMIRENPSSLSLLLKLGAEAVKTGNSLGYNVASPMKDFTVEQLEEAAAGGMPELAAGMTAEPPGPNEGKPSLLQDIMKGRKTEIDYLNGYIVRRAQTIGLPAPYSAAVTAVVKGIEAGEFQMGMENVNRVRAIAEAR